MVRTAPKYPGCPGPRHSPETSLRGQSSSKPFRTAQTTISCFEATPSFT